MADRIVRDRTGMELGKIKELEFGILKAYNRSNTELGTYNPAVDKTYDRLGLTIGSGNQLVWLIEQARQD